MIYQQEEKRNMIIDSYRNLQEEVCCRRVMEQCLHALAGYLSDERIEDVDAWMKLLYQYCVADYFPGNFTCDLTEGERDAVLFCLQTLQQILQIERERIPFLRTRDFELLTEEQVRQCEIRQEYEHFLACYKESYIYEFLRISRECTPFDTLGHIAGVHHVAIFVGKQLEQIGVKVDLGLVSASAILHDIGKFGCKGQEVKRIPYLHYFYSDQFARAHDLPLIGHIAANHSTWDLELENLSVENLLLIYADFRVKSKRVDGKEVVCFWSLDDSYDVILSKLDNVDDAKKRRYQKVFMKLKDFEDFLTSQGVATDLHSDFHEIRDQAYPALLEGDELVTRWKYLAIRNNLSIMRMMTVSAEFINLIENIKSEKDWKNIRMYMNVIDEYSTYMTVNQKQLIIDYFSEMLMHKDGDIRRQAARIIGKLLGQFDIRYTKEVPPGALIPQAQLKGIEVWESLIRKMLIPGHKVTQTHRRWIGYAIKTVYRTLMSYLPQDRRQDYLEVLIRHYQENGQDLLYNFILMDCAADICCEDCSCEQQKQIVTFARQSMLRGDMELKVATLRFFYIWICQGYRPDADLWKELEEIIEQEWNAPESYFYLYKAIRNLLFDESHIIQVTDEQVREIFLENQKMDTPWIFKLVHLDILNGSEILMDSRESFQYAAHLVNLLQTSDRIVIRHMAGDSLVALMDRLEPDQRYEIVLELIRALEINDYSISKYIPRYLGMIFTMLSEDAQENLLQQYRHMMNHNNEKIVITTLEAVGETLVRLIPGDHLNEVEYAIYEKKKIMLEGMIMKGLAHYRTDVNLEAAYIVGHHIFGNPELSLRQKEAFFVSMYKKMYLLMTRQTNLIGVYTYAAVWNYIYRFISDQIRLEGRIHFQHADVAIFFPGTFDPFSLGHKEIVERMQERDCEIYLAVDEFSWSKKTQPYEIRKNIIRMSVADIPHVYLFPSELPINIANPVDLKQLKDLYAHKNLYIAMGSDVVENASAYRIDVTDYSIHQFNHIIFNRKKRKDEDITDKFEKYRAVIKGDIKLLSLGQSYEEISSTKIRNNIDMNRDISNLIDHCAQNYIYDYGLYIREPVYKMMLRSKSLDGFYQHGIEEGFLEEMKIGLLSERVQESKVSDRYLKLLPSEDIIYLRDTRNYNRLCGMVTFHTLKLCDVFEECGNIEATQWIRSHIYGKIGVISGLYSNETDGVEENKQRVLTELFAWCMEEEYSWLLCFDPALDTELMARQGFLAIPHGQHAYMVNLSNPILLFDNVRDMLKEPFRSDEHVFDVTKEAHRKLQRAMCKLYPGNLVLSIESELLNHYLVKRIARENGVPTKESSVRRLGPKLCVPFGKMLRNTRVPNSVTKQLHTEKFYSSDMHHFIVREYPNYADLRTQIRTLRSLNRPVMLIDDLYHKGYRLSSISPIFEEEDLKIDKFIVAVLSGQGKDLAKQKGLDVESVYYIPNLRCWFMESELYPFISGDSIDQNQETEIKYALPSINDILPYQMPPFLREADKKAFYYMSEVCLGNSLSILDAIEQQYQKENKRKLTMGRISEVMCEPRYPDTGLAADFDPNQSPSYYLEYELERLKRFESFIF